MSESGIRSEDRARAQAAFRALNDSPMQRRLRAEHASFSAVVYWRPGDCDAAELRREFKRMKATGFNAVRFHTANPVETEPGQFDFRRTDEWFDAASDAGLKVVMHTNLDRPSDALLARHGLTSAQFDKGTHAEPAARAALEAHIAPIVRHCAAHPALLLWGLYGEPEPGEGALTDDAGRARFGEWLRARHGSLEALDKAWNIYPERAKPSVPSFEEAWKLLEKLNADPQISGVHRSKVVYGAARDLLRYLTEKEMDRARVVLEIIRKHDPEHPVSTGSHQILINQASLRWDLGAWARLGDLYYTSIHLSWHFEPVQGEVDRPVYIMARQTRDYFKGAWTSCFETTGGAVQYSGGYGNAMSAGQMRRFILSYLAAGNLSIAFWTWNHRPGGWEAGDYGLTSLSGQLTPWAEEAGRLARALDRYRAELWEAEHEPRVAVLESWDTQAIYTLEPERHDLQEGVGRFGRGTLLQASRARTGVSRALLNHHIPFEYLTSAELQAGIALRYPVIYAPHLRALSAEVLEALHGYVAGGGRLIADVQFGFMDCWGKVAATGPGTARERLFGAYVDTIHDARTAPHTVNGIPIAGFYGDLKPTTARVLAAFPDGSPAITENRLGRGAAVFLAFDASRMCWLPDRPDMESLIAEVVCAGAAPTWRTAAPLAFRLCSPRADHYFLLNDGAPRDVLLEVFDRTYRAGQDVTAGQALDLNGTLAVRLPERSGVWLRLERE